MFAQKEIINKFPLLALENLSQIQILVYSFLYAILVNWLTTFIYIGIRIAIKGHYKKKLSIDIDDLISGIYSFNIHLIEYHEQGDIMLTAISYARVQFEKISMRAKDVTWHPNWWGNIHLPTEFL